MGKYLDSVVLGTGIMDTLGVVHWLRKIWGIPGQCGPSGQPPPCDSQDCIQPLHCGQCSKPERCRCRCRCRFRFRCRCYPCGYFRGGRVKESDGECCSQGGVWARPGPGAGPPAQVRPAGACPARRRRSGPPGPPGPPAQVRPTRPSRPAGAGPAHRF